MGVIQIKDIKFDHSCLYNSVKLNTEYLKTVSIKDLIKILNILEFSRLSSLLYKEKDESLSSLRDIL